MCVIVKFYNQVTLSWIEIQTKQDANFAEFYKQKKSQYSFGKNVLTAKTKTNLYQNDGKINM